jgi:GntR family transcriptional regulator, rspAB operon transcriptional repressor
MVVNKSLASANVLAVDGPIGPRLHQALRTAIVGGDMLPGTHLSEAEIAQEKRVSRQPVREAFIKLAEEGLVEIRPQRGTFVSRISLRQVEDARFMREAIEADIAREVAVSATPNLLVKLRRQVRAQAALTFTDARAFTLLDDQFHRTISAAAGREGAWRILDGLKSHMDRVRHLTAQRFPLAEIVVQHGAILYAIATGDPDRAEDCVRHHLKRILEHLPLIRFDVPEYFCD